MWFVIKVLLDVAEGSPGVSTTQHFGLRSTWSGDLLRRESQFTQDFPITTTPL